MRNFADYALFYAAMSYQIPVGMGTVEPKVVYRNVNNYEDLIDAGLSVQFDNLTANQLSVYGMYHNTNCATVGFELSFKDDLSFTGLYTTRPADFGRYSNGSFELGVRLRVMGKKAETGE